MKRFFAILLMVCGSIVVLWTLLWLLSYFIEGGLDGEGLKASFGHEFLFWAPVSLFCIPGFLLIYHGRRLMSKQQMHLLAIHEVAILFAIMGIIAALAFPVDNFSYIAARIITDSVKVAEPLKTAIERHYSQQRSFPNSTKVLGDAIPDTKRLPYIHSITVSDGGRIVITFDTKDIHWDWAYWHYLLFRKPNDLTGLTLVLVPTIINETVAWDECTEGTVPQRNRHFKCSGHQ